jgi:hypothetical protein
LERAFWHRLEALAMTFADGVGLSLDTLGKMVHKNDDRGKDEDERRPS